MRELRSLVGEPAHEFTRLVQVDIRVEMFSPPCLNRPRPYIPNKTVSETTDATSPNIRSPPSRHVQWMDQIHFAPPTQKPNGMIRLPNLNSNKPYGLVSFTVRFFGFRETIHYFTGVPPVSTETTREIQQIFATPSAAILP